MSTVAAPLTVTFYFETSRAAGKPEEILTHMCHEQTTTGYDTLAGLAAAPRLAPYQASGQRLRMLPSAGGAVESGYAAVDFPWASVRHLGSALEDALTREAGRVRHGKGLLTLRTRRCRLA